MEYEFGFGVVLLILRISTRDDVVLVDVDGVMVEKEDTLLCRITSDAWIR